MGEYVKRFSGIEKQVLRKLDMLHHARDLNDLRAPPANRLEALKRNRRGQYSIRINAIAKCERSVTADTALRLARFFGTSPEFWMNLQAIHDLTKARLQSGAAIERDVRPRAA